MEKEAEGQERARKVDHHPERRKLEHRRQVQVSVTKQEPLRIARATPPRYYEHSIMYIATWLMLRRRGTLTP